MQKLITASSLALAFLGLCQMPASAACGVSYTFSNGTTADASQVNQNFSDLSSCAAPVSSPSFTGAVSLGGGAASTTAFTVNFNGSGTYGLASNDTETGGKLWGFGGGIGGPGSFGFYNLTDNLHGPIFFGDGKVGIGSSTDGGWSGAAGLESVRHGGYAVSAYQTDNSGAAIAARLDASSGSLFADFRLFAGSIGSIALNGGATGVVYNTTSDMRLKKIDADQRDLGSVIRSLWVGSFEKWGNFRHEGPHGPSFGVLAQQAYSVLPPSVRDSAITKPKDANSTWMASSEPFAYLALWGVKDMYTARDAESRRVAELEARAESQDRQIATLLNVSANLQAQVQSLKKQVLATNRVVGVRTARN